MEVLKISAFAIVATVLIVLVKQEKKEIGIVISILVAVLITTYGILKLDDIISLIYNLTSKTGINVKYFEIILKVVGIAYIVELTKDVCIDAGETALGSKVEMTGKIMIVAMTLPIITGIVEVLNKLI